MLINFNYLGGVHFYTNHLIISGLIFLGLSLLFNIIALIKKEKKLVPIMILVVDLIVMFFIFSLISGAMSF